MITVTHDDGRPLFTFRSQDGDLVLVVSDPDVDIIVPSADELAAATTKHDEVVAAVGTKWMAECVHELLDTVTMGDLFDCAAGDLAIARGATDYAVNEPTDADKLAYDLAFFDVVDVVVAEMRSTWGGYYDTQKRPLGGGK